MNIANDPPILWRPSEERVANANMTRFMAEVRKRHGLSIPDYDALHRWSVEDRAAFWSLLWDFCGITGEKGAEPYLVDGDKLPGARFFPQGRLNFAENLLHRRDDGLAITFRAEHGGHRRLTWRELYDQVSRLAQALKAEGVGPGDRVAGFVPNIPETLIAMLAATSLGAIWSSCSPDFGVKGVMDRFGQIEPKVLFTADGYTYAGKRHDSLERAKGIAADLPGLQRLIVIPYLAEKPDITGVDPRAVLLPDYVAPYTAGEIAFTRLDANAPLFIVYSSGTTGLPKCMVHSIAGTLLKLRSEHVLHNDMKPGDRLLYYTTCGWVMWNWTVSAIASDVVVMLYDGSPFHPDNNVLFDYAAAEGCTHFGVSAKYIDAIGKAGLDPAKTHDLSTVRAVLSTGSPLAPASFDYVREHVKSDAQLISFSGGTDIMGAFVGGNPIGPVYRGEIQCKYLGMDVAVFDDDGRPLIGEKGELVCRKAFPSVPIMFWNDPDGRKFHEAYFDQYPNVWRHGDWAELTPRGGMVIYGRSDATLNPGGVRIGTAEIYRQVEQIDAVVESLVIGQQWENDVRVVLFVRLRDGLTLDDALRDEIRRRVRQNATPRHVPAKIVQVADIPRTISGKIVELAVRNIVHGRPVKNRDALANPEALELFKDLPELAT